MNLLKSFTDLLCLDSLLDSQKGPCTASMYSFPDLEPVCCSMSSSNCCFLTCIQEAGKVVWYFHLFQNFPQSAVTYTVKDFSVVNEAKVDVFLEFPCFFYKPAYLGNWISGPSTFSKPSLNIWKFLVHIRLKPRLLCKILSMAILACAPAAAAKSLHS